MSNVPAPGVYTIDPVHSTFGFMARHLVASKVRGRFTDFSGTLTIGETVEASHVEAEAEAASISTNNEMRDNHLRSADFLEQEKWPKLTFKSKKITPKSGDKYELVGDLTVRDVTKTLTFDVEYLGSSPSMLPGVTVVGFEATTEIDRRDFGVNFEGSLENGSLIVSHKIVLEIAIEASKQD
ncbi:MAG TPA: YceI family protein [Acidimicrobiales bacterium]|nr:YceI family protein [Acidimicrobiales bacterium]